MGRPEKKLCLRHQGHGDAGLGSALASYGKLGVAHVDVAFLVDEPGGDVTGIGRL